MKNGQYSDSLIYKRHSVREFTSAPVAQEMMGHLLHAGMAGPSAHNRQPWSFVVIDERPLLDAIADFHPYAKMMRQASAAIVVCAIKEVVAKDIFYQQDLGAAVQNILLAATECGLGSCWCGIHPRKELEDEFVKLLKMPDSIFPFALIALGHPAASAPPSDRYDASRVQRNAW